MVIYHSYNNFHDLITHVGNKLIEESPMQVYYNSSFDPQLKLC